ncbi:MAG: hypothetical protein IT373_12800 [Polyangiaceae bacterium]|nr:hypothetical protein [Polyangiaceae bacterium]
MKPAEHPDFFRVAPPGGQSRESRIVLDRHGSFWHEGERVAHPALRAALGRWIARHPVDRRYVLTNGHDWCYLTVEDTPYFVVALQRDADRAELELSDGTREPLDPGSLAIGAEGELRARVKGGSFEARFSRHAQLSMEPLLCEDDDGVLCVALEGRRHAVPAIGSQRERGPDEVTAPARR